MTDKEVMQMALDCLLAWEKEEVYGWGETDHKCVEALRAALTQPEPKYSDIVSDGGYDPRSKNEDYERGFVDGMQEQMKSSVDRAVNNMPTKIFGPNLKEILNSAGFYQKEWVGLTDEEIREGNSESWVTTQAWQSACWWAEAKLKDKNT